MNKKGFTLVEIIISIVLITIIGTSFIFFVVSENNSDLKKISDIIMTSAQTFLETEVDEKGNTYKEGIFKGGTAVVIPLKELQNSGYLSDDMIKTLEDNSVSLDEYILAAVFSDSKDYCSNSESIIKFEASWNSKLKNNSTPVYLCQYEVKGETEKVNFQVDLNKMAVSENFYNNLNLSDKASYFTEKENGEYLFYNEEELALYKYYRGAVKNNYVKFGTQGGNDLIWRIVWFKDTNEAKDNGYEQMKLVLDNVVPIYLETTNGSKVYIENGDQFHYLNSHRSNYCYFLLSYDNVNNIISNLKLGDYTFELDGNSKYYYCSNGNRSSTLIYENEGLNFDDIFFAESFESKDYIYSKQLLDWYESTDLSSYNVSSKDWLLENHCYTKRGNPYYSAFGFDSTDFDCMNENSRGTGELFSWPVSTLTFGDAIRAGLSLNSNGIFSDNYLINNNKTYVQFGPHSLTSVGGYYNVYSISNQIGALSSLSNSSSTLVENDTGSKKLVLTTNGVEGVWNTQLRNFIKTKSFTFVADSIKPSIIIDLTKAKLGNEKGISSNPYTLIVK